jgi:hypothetical protein
LREVSRDTTATTKKKKPAKKDDDNPEEEEEETKLVVPYTSLWDGLRNVLARNLRMEEYATTVIKLNIFNQQCITSPSFCVMG